MSDRIVSFLRKRDFKFVRELGQGACGQTVLLFDETIDESFVCKKFAPMAGLVREDLYANFVRETKILHRLSHDNIVRVFSYFLYPERKAGYILMEFVDGVDIEEYLVAHPEQAVPVFEQVVSAFAYLERFGVLHRDIRPRNILVDLEGVSKVIDFGFGKQTSTSADFTKSISINWWCSPPEEFQRGIYDHRTEVYFVGKLFEKVVSLAGADQFQHSALLKKMCVFESSERTQSFADVRRALVSKSEDEHYFSESDRDVYRNFADSLKSCVVKIEHGSKYFSVEEVERRLSRQYTRMMLEDYVSDRAKFVGCFINGSFRYKPNAAVPIWNVLEFMRMLEACGRGRKEIVLENICARLDAVPRYHRNEIDDDIPF